MNKILAKIKTLATLLEKTEAETLDFLVDELEEYDLDEYKFEEYLNWYLPLHATDEPLNKRNWFIVNVLRLESKTLFPGIYIGPLTIPFELLGK